MTASTPLRCPRCGGALRADAAEGLCPRCLAALPLATETELDGTASHSAALPLTPEELAPHFPQLEILECLGRGGMGVVYKARQKSLKRLVALKLLAPERAGDQAFAERFAREAQALAALNHPNIVAVHDFGQAAGFFFLLMEYVDGVNLRWAMRGGRFTPEQALMIVPPVCEALQFAHEHGIVHRDIKPENLLLDRERRIKIVDFGIAKILGESSSVGVEESQPAGTPQYMAPEQKANSATDHRADIYSLGVVLYEMLTGEHPKGKIESPSRRVQLDVRIDEIVLRALESNPELRYQTAVEFRTQVETVATSLDRSPPAAPAANPAPAANAPYFSRTAIVSAAWMILFFAVVPAFVWHESNAHEFYRRGPFASPLETFIFFTFVFPGFTSPFGTTVLGWIAVAQIRRSSGRLYGLGFAVFNSLLFPLLALDAIIAWFFYHLGQALALWPNLSKPAQWSQYLIASAVTAALADLAIARRVWRAISAASDGANNTQRLPATGWRALGWAALIICGVCAAIYWPSLNGNTRDAQDDQAAALSIFDPTPVLHVPTGFSVGVMACSQDGHLLAIANTGPRVEKDFSGRLQISDKWGPKAEILDAGTGAHLASLELTTPEEQHFLKQTRTDPHFEITALAFSTDSRLLAVGSGFGQVKFYDAATGRFVRALDDATTGKEDGRDPGERHVLPRALGRVTSLAFSPDGHTLAVAGGSFADAPLDTYDFQPSIPPHSGPGRLQLWDVDSGALLFDPPGHAEHLVAVAFSADGRLLASAGNWLTDTDFGWSVKVWSVATGTLQGDLPIPGNSRPRSITFAPDGRGIIVGTQRFADDRPEGASSGAVSLVQIATGHEDWRQAAPDWTNPVAFSVALAPGGQSVVVLSGNKTLSVLDVATGHLRATFRTGVDTALSAHWHAMSVAPRAGLLVLSGIEASQSGFLEVQKFANPAH